MRDRTRKPVAGAPTGKTAGDGRFTLVRRLGQGSLGVVWLARDERLGQEVALKMLPDVLAHDPAALQDLQRETAKSQKLSHPNIVRIFELFRFEQEPAFITMEYVEGMPLHLLKASQEHKCLRWDYLARLAGQMCAALEHAHERKVVHRDFKPANLILDAGGNIKLADFGLAATAANTFGQVTSNMGATGTPCYMSPQQMEGRPPKPADDIYSIGATLYELLVSEPPFHAADGLRDAGNIFDKTRAIPAKPPEQRMMELDINNPIPTGVSAAIMACLAKDPSERPSSATVLAERLGVGQSQRPSPMNPSRAMGQLGQVAPPREPPKLARGFQQRLAIKLAIVALVTVVALLVILAMTRK